nr:MAG TPA: hypothetical protein [Caudoviricetes sp.]
MVASVGITKHQLIIILHHIYVVCQYLNHTIFLKKT